MNDKRTILVLDDEAHITRVVALKLRNAGFEVLTGGDGEEGHELAVRHAPDAIITDLQMPYLSGVEMCRKLKQNTATENIPVILLTARGARLSDDDLIGTNIRTMLSKPFSPREVLERVLTLLESPGEQTDPISEAA